MAKRLLNRVELHPLQRGFRDVDGTFSNTILLDHYVKVRKAAGKAFIIVSLDVRNAFDTVSYHSVHRALIRKGIDSGLHYVHSGYPNLYHGWTSAHSTFILEERGLSRVLDELIAKLSNTSSGSTIAPGTRIAALEFADDIVLMENQDGSIFDEV